jgi:hypothetical protein
VRGGWGGPGERGSERGQAEDFQNASHWRCVES